MEDRQDMTPTERALQYAEDVVDGRIVVGLYVRLACQRFLKDLERQDTDEFPYVYSAELGDRYVRFLEKLPHIKGEWASRRETYRAEPWQCFCDCNAFGWIHRQTHLRRFRVAFELQPRKSGKSFRMAGRAIYMAFLDGEAGAEFYVGATTEKQAFEVYRPAWMMVDKLPKLRAAKNISLSGNAKNPGTMFRARDMSKVEPMIGKPGDGSSPHGAVIDEYHEHDTDHTFQTMQTGMGARRQPLLSVISTAGSNLNSPCYEMEMEMRRILEGNVKDETIFAVMWGIDPDDDWTSIEAVKKANPNFGVSVSEEFLVQQLEQAKRSPSKQNAFRTKHLNEWVGAKTAWMNMSEWALREKKMSPDDFLGCECQMSADLSSKKDATAIDLTFKKGESYFSFKKFFVPEGALEWNEKYRDFSSCGDVEVTPGAMIDQEQVEDFIKSWIEKYKPIDVAFDEWNADYMMSRLEKRKIEVIKFPFTTKYVSEPMMQLEALVLDGKYFHDGNKCMTWMVGNVTAREDIRGNIFPNKARANDPLCKKDGVDVAIMSIGRFMSRGTNVPKKPKFQVHVF